MRYFRSGRPIMPYVYSTVHSFVATNYSKYLLAVVLEAPICSPISSICSRYSAAISFGYKLSVSLRMLPAKRMPPTMPANNTANEKSMISFVLLSMLDSIPFSELPTT